MCEHVLFCISRKLFYETTDCRFRHPVAHCPRLSLSHIHSMCCSPHDHDAKGVARLFVRIGLGLSLAFVGFTHYQNPQFAESVGRGLGLLEPLGMVWGYVLPGLLIIGGLLLAFGIYTTIAAYCAAIALASIPAGLMLKSAISGISLDETMPPALNALIWILVLLAALKGAHGGCGTGCACGPNCDSGPNCDCCDLPGKSMPSMKSTPVAPAAMMMMKTPPKKSSTKKGPSRKSL